MKRNIPVLSMRFVMLPALLFMLLPLSAALLSPVTARAADSSGKIRVATVDVNRVLNSLKEAQGKKAELDMMKKKMESQITAKRDALKALETKTKDKETPQNVEQLRRETRDFERLVKDSDEDFKRRFLAVNRDLTEKALKLVSQYAQKHGVDLVLDKGEGGQGPVLFGSPDADITEAIIKAVP
jgi:Skp family chaperone for outer membrane proteins